MIDLTALARDAHDAFGSPDRWEDLGQAERERWERVAARVSRTRADRVLIDRLQEMVPERYRDRPDGIIEWINDMLEEAWKYRDLCR